MMQNLLLRHNLSRDDITEDDNVDSMRFTRMACPVNGRRGCNWEKNLAAYMVNEIFPMTSWYFGMKGHRTFFWFYGPPEGYVRGLPRYQSTVDSNDTVVSESALIHARTLAAQKAARDWLMLECGVSLASSGGSGRSQHDPAAADRGKQHGSKHDLRGASGRKRIGTSEICEILRPAI